MAAKRLPWIKIWPEHIEHGKLCELDDATYRTWHYMLAKASRQPQRWTFTSVRHASAATGRPEKHIRTLIRAGLIDELPSGGLTVHNVRKWQAAYPSDIVDYHAKAPDKAPANTPANTPGEPSANAPGNLLGPLNTRWEIGDVRRKDDLEHQTSGDHSATGVSRYEEFKAAFITAYPPNSNVAWNWRTVESHLKKISPDDYEKVIATLAKYRLGKGVQEGIVLNPRRFLEEWQPIATVQEMTFVTVPPAPELDAMKARIEALIGA